jgi:predicted membrane metal-binding protein
VHSPAPVREAFNYFGTVHLLSVSVFYVAAVCGAIFFLRRFLIKLIRFQLFGRLSSVSRPSMLAAISAL